VYIIMCVCFSPICQYCEPHLSEDALWHSVAEMVTSLWFKDYEFSDFTGD